MPLGNVVERIVKNRWMLIIILVILIFTSWRRDGCEVKQPERQFVNKELVSSLCNCAKIIRADAAALNQNRFHWCSVESDLRGPHQRVVTYSLYGDANNASTFRRYYSLMNNLSMTVEKQYPGWTLRIYHAFTERDREAYGALCNIYCRFPHVDLCNVRELWERIGNTTVPIDPALLSDLNRKIYRFLVMLDPHVDVFISRDVDSLIFRREVTAVEQWLQSNYTFHVMRDHTNHQSTILAGMWGAKLFQRRDLIEGLMRLLVVAGQDAHHFRDQSTLDSIFWPVVRYDVMAHDSYNCENGRLLQRSPLKMFPFPTQREGRLYVGGAGVELYADKCPVTCRPSEHKDWEYC